MLNEDYRTVDFSELESTEYGETLLESARLLTIEYGLFDSLSNSQLDSLCDRLADAMHRAANEIVEQ
jgi:hypothetical protein